MAYRQRRSKKGWQSIMANNPFKSPDDALEAMQIMVSDGGQVGTVEIPDAVKKSIGAQIASHAKVRESILDAVEKEYGKRTREVLEDIAQFILADMTTRKMIHKSNIPMVIEEEMFKSMFSAMADVFKHTFDLLMPEDLQISFNDELPASQRKLKPGEPGEWPQGKLMKIATKLAKADSNAMEKITEDIGSFVKATRGASNGSEDSGGNKPAVRH
jgi:hypothetical protein